MESDGPKHGVRNAAEDGLLASRPPDFLIVIVDSLSISPEFQEDHSR